jgi:subtilase family serine protease
VRSIVKREQIVRRILRGPAGFVAGAAFVCTGAVAVSGPAQAADSGHHPPTTSTASDLRSRVTGKAILGTSGWQTITNEQAAPSGTPSKSQQIKVLKAVLKFMTDNYANYSSYTPGPQDIFDYGIGSLWEQGIDGSGTTVAVIEGWDDPNIGKQIAAFDKPFGLPNPQIQTIFPSGDGKLPSKCPPGMVKLGSYGSCSAWQGELQLDVESAHLIAPYAKIIISATPADSEITDDAASQVAPPEMMEALEHIASSHLANVISISDGTGESSYSHGDPEILAQDPGELATAAAGIPVIVATGDCGVVQNLPSANGQCEDVSSTADVATWDDSPWITALGGSVPNVSPVNGASLGPDPLWHVSPPEAEYSENAGLSEVFARPSYQNGVASITGSSMRSLPDITMDAQDGTSEAAPLFAGVLALATQENSHANVGPINTVLYEDLGPAGSEDGIADVVSGNESAETPEGVVTVPGYTAGTGFDIASGWGTISAPAFVPALVTATQGTKEDKAIRAHAESQLKALESGIDLSSTSIPSDGSSDLSAGNFLPGHPVKLYIDGKLITTLTASSGGTVSYVIKPSVLELESGRHTLKLTSMLLDQNTSFTVT